jgi:hypothetical protein
MASVLSNNSKISLLLLIVVEPSAAVPKQIDLKIMKSGAHRYDGMEGFGFADADGENEGRDWNWRRKI